MRSLTILALAALLAAGCGDDEPEAAPASTTARPTSPAPAVDTALGDTTAATAARAGARPARPAAEGAGGAESAEAETRAASGAGRSADRLYTVQVAAFENPRSATEWVERLRDRGFPVWSAVAEVRGHTFHRVRIGAVPTVSEARTLGAYIMNRYDWPVWVAPITPAERVPADAVERTRRALGGG